MQILLSLVVLLLIGEASSTYIMTGVYKGALNGKNYTCLVPAGSCVAGLGGTGSVILVTCNGPEFNDYCNADCSRCQGLSSGGSGTTVNGTTPFSTECLLPSAVTDTNVNCPLVFVRSFPFLPWIGYFSATTSTCYVPGTETWQSQATGCKVYQPETAIEFGPDSPTLNCSDSAWYNRPGCLGNTQYENTTTFYGCVAGAIYYGGSNCEGSPGYCDRCANKSAPCSECTYDRRFVCATDALATDANCMSYLTSSPPPTTGSPTTGSPTGSSASLTSSLFVMIFFLFLQL